MLNVGCTVQFVSSLMITENKRQILLYPKTEPNVINPKQAGEGGGGAPSIFCLGTLIFFTFFPAPSPQPPTVNIDWEPPREIVTILSLISVTAWKKWLFGQKQKKIFNKKKLNF